MSVADVYDALVNEHCYKDAFSPEEAFHKIRSQFEKIAIVKLYTEYNIL